MSKTWKKVIKILAIVVIGVATLMVVWLISLQLFWHSFITLLEKKSEPPVCEVEEWEKELLIEEYPYSEDTIREGKLNNSQLALLNEIRTGMSYLEEKYPGYKFSINYRDDWAVTIIDYWVTEETTGESFKLRFHTDEERKHQPEDDFYIYFIEDAYQEYMEDQFMQRSDNVTEVTVSITRTRGEGYDNNITMEDVLSGKLDLDPSINVYVLASEGTETWCEQYTETEMQKAVEELNLSGTYAAHFYIFPEGFEQVEENEKYIDYSIIHWKRKGENDG